MGVSAWAVFVEFRRGAAKGDFARLDLGFTGAQGVVGKSPSLQLLLGFKIEGPMPIRI